MYIGCKEKKRYPEINVLHVLGAMMILLCHFTQKSHLSAVSELFITGVPLFLFVSGFLAALKPTHGKDWFLKRCTRILTPYYLWIIPGLCILLISSRDVVSPFQAIIIMLNLQGLNYFFWKFDHYVAVIGFGHLWFLTKIMFCYALVPILDVTVRQWIGLKTKWWGILLCTLILIVQPIMLMLGVQLSYIITFCLGYCISVIGVRITDSLIAKITAGCIVSNLLRLFVKRYFDGTMMYDRYIVQISSAAIGIWIFFAVFWLSYRMPCIMSSVGKSKWVEWLANISFEIYLVHFWFLNGKWQVANYIDSPLLSDMVVFVLSIVFAWILHNAAQKLVEKLNAKFICRE